MHQEKMLQIMFYTLLPGLMTIRMRNLNYKVKQAMDMWELGKITAELVDDDQFQ
jgi:hypothetical protein